MKNLQQRAGQSTRDMARKRYKKRARFILITAGIALLIIIISYKSNLLGIGGLGAVQNKNGLHNPELRFLRAER
jgi:hypothetical protein